MSLPILLLDIDGVVGPIGPTPHYEGGAEWFDLLPGRMHFSTHVLNELRRIEQDKIADVRWLSSWQDDAATNLATTLNLPDWPAYTKRDIPSARMWMTDWWKEAIVSNLLLQGHQVAWCEDNIPYEGNLMALKAFEDQLLCIAPEPGLGLTPSDLTLLRAWLMSKNSEEHSPYGDESP